MESKIITADSGDRVVAQLLDIFHKCVARINVSGVADQGTGFFVAPELLLTCAHVIKECFDSNGERIAGRAVVVTWEGNVYDNVALKEHWLNTYPDLALLEVPVEGHPCALLEDSFEPTDRLYCYGYPSNKKQIRAEGMQPDAEGQMNVERVEGIEEYIKFKAAQTFPGFSGGPLLNLTRGVVCGIIRRSRDIDTDLGGYAIRSKVILNHIPYLKEAQEEYHRRNTEWISARRNSKRDYSHPQLSQLRASAAGITSGRDKDAEKPEPISIHLNLNEKIVDREAECAAILDELRKKDGRRILPIVAPAGFGKTSLVIKVLQQVTDGESIKDSAVNALLTIDCKEGAFTIGKVFEKAGRLIGQSLLFQQIYAGHDQPLKAKLEEFFKRLSAAGEAWIVLDNFEHMLDGNSIKDEETSQFIEACLTTNQRLRIIINARRLPQLNGLHHLSSLSMVNDGLIQGLPEAHAISYLRNEGADCGLSEAESSAQLLRDVARRVHYIPMALRSVVGYLRRRYPALTLKEFINDHDLLRDFDRHDYEIGLNRLLDAQLSLLSANEKMILSAIAFFPRPIPQDALEYLLPKTELLEILGSLDKDKLVETQKDMLGVRRYTLHPIIREHRLLKIHGDQFNLSKEFAEHCWEKGFHSYNNASYLQSVDLFDCAVTVFRHLPEGQGRNELANDLAGALINKGVSLDSLGRLNEALDCYDEAIETYRGLIISGCDELANDLAGALINKGNSLSSLHRLNEALTCYDKAIETYRDLIISGRDELANDLAIALMNKGNNLCSIGRLDEALYCYDEMIETYISLAISGRDELVNELYLAMGLMNKGIALRSLGRLKEAIAYYDEAIETYRSHFISGCGEIVNDLARVLTNKGVALSLLGQLNEALVCYNEAIETYRYLVKSGRDELANDLARSLINKGTALHSLGRLNEALSCIDEATEIRRGLVISGRDELASDLALALINKGVTLRSLGQLNDTLSCYDEAIETYRRLVTMGRDEIVNDLARALINKSNALHSLGLLHESLAYSDEAIETYRGMAISGRDEMANDLPRALINKGVALRALGQLDEALACYDMAIETYRSLVTSGRHELANDLAMVLMTKALVLENTDKLDSALSHYEEAIIIILRCVEIDGLTHLLSLLLRMIRYRLMTFIKLRRWAEAADDVRFFLLQTEKAQVDSYLNDPAQNEINQTIEIIRELPDEVRERIYEGMGSDSDRLKRLVDR